MKTAMFALFLLFTFTSSATAAVIRDIDGNHLINSGRYRILRNISAQGGGIALGRTDKETYPLTVVQLPSGIQKASSLRLTLPVRIAVIRTNSSLDFFFVAAPKCASQPSKCTIVEGEDGTKSVKITGYEQTLEGWFKIQEYSGVYKIEFCPNNGDSCEDVGISKDDNGNRRLVITHGNPFARVPQS